MSTGEEPYSSGYTAQPISTVTEEHSYIYASGMLLREGSTTKTLDFRYDNVGYPYALIYNNGSTTATYYYITNLQGDVMYLVDSNGNQVAAYTYDPYGKILSAYGSMAEINPLRYRGYYYDAETGFYYLQSRYYDPNTCRFINADSYTSTGRGLIGYNMFAYCENDPVNYKDVGGLMAGRAITVAICDGSGWLGETYATLELAAKAFLMEYFGYTKLFGHEYGAILYQRQNENGVMRYRYGKAQTSYSSAIVWIYPEKDQDLLDKGWEPIGDIHTHPGPKSFSTEDIEYNEDKLSENDNFVAFVGTTTGRLYRYDNTGESYVSRFLYKLPKSGKKPVVVFTSMKM